MTESNQPRERDRDGEQWKRPRGETDTQTNGSAASLQQPGPSPTLTGIVFPSCWDQAVFLSCCVDVFAIQGHGIDLSSLKGDRKGDRAGGCRDLTEVPGLGLLGALASGSLPWGTPALVGQRAACRTRGLRYPALALHPWGSAAPVAGPCSGQNGALPLPAQGLPARRGPGHRAVPPPHLAKGWPTAQVQYVFVECVCECMNEPSL